MNYECVVGKILTGKTKYLHEKIKGHDSLFINHLYPADLKTIKKFKGDYLVIDNIDTLNIEYQYIISALMNLNRMNILISAKSFDSLIPYLKTKIVTVTHLF